MIAIKSLQEKIYDHLFPGGAIPFACKDYILAIDARIQEIEQLAQGKVLEGMNHRVSDPAASRQLTAQIVQLRDSCSPPMSYREIVRRLGNCISPDAARNRYDDATQAAQEAAMQKEGYAAISGEAILASEIAVTAEDGKSKKNETDILPAAPPALLEDKPEQCEEATIRKSQVVEKVEEVAETRNKFGRYETPVSAEIDAEISRMDAEGMSCRQISNELAKKGILLTWQRVRGRITLIAKTKHRTTIREAPQAPSLPCAETPREAACGTQEEKQPAPKSISRADLNIMIWEAWQRGDSPEKISQDLNAEGYYYNERQVVNRLKQQGAQL